MSIDEILGVHDEQSTWFQNFLDRKTELYEKSWSDVINANSQNKLRDQLAQIRKDNGDKGVPKPGELANRELIDAYMKGEIPADADIGKLRNNFRKAIEKTMRDLSKSYQSDSWIEQNVVLDYDDQVVENAIEKFGNYVPLLEEAYDEMKEELLEVKSKLYANRQVLAHEAKQTRFPTPKGKLSAEARNEMLIYARSIALYRLQATEMQDRLQELQGQVGARNFPDEGAQKLHETLYAGVEPLSSKPKETGVHRQLQEHFAVEVPMNLSSSILPDTEACRKIEQAAMRDALLEFNKDDQNALDEILADVNEPDSTLNMPNTKKSFLNVPKKQTGSVEKEQKTTTDAPWQAELERVESKAIETAHQHYYMGGLFPVAGKGDEKHPRELLEEIMEGLERNADDEDLIKKLYAGQGFGVTPDTTSEEETDQVPTDEESEREEIEMEQLALDEMEGYKALILKSPMEYFMRMRVKEAMQNLRGNQITEREGTMESEEDWNTLKAYNDRVRHNDVRPDDNSDPINYHRHAHDLSILELKEGLTKAVSQRKAQALPLAISIFNRIQDKIVKTTRLDHDSESKDVSEDLHKLDILLNDQSSPLMSTLRSCGRYVHEKLPETLDAYRSTVKDGDILDQPVDLNRMINDYRALNKSEDTVKSMEAQLSAIELRLQAESKQIEHKTTKQAYDSWLKKSKQGVEAAKDSYLKKLYDDYLIQDSNISDATKVHLMQDVFRVEVGENFINSDANKSDSTFPVFFAHDLVKFGIRKQMPAAVRLGELILAEHCSGDAKMPEELARAVKEYMFEHQEQYQAAAKYTGPISATQIYHQARQSGTGEQPVFMTMDDPYWVKFQKENYRREDNWRLPSVHAWEHKPYGILGEVLDLKRFEKTMHEQQSKM